VTVAVKGVLRECRRSMLSEANEILLEPGAGSLAPHLHQVSAFSLLRAPSSAMTSVAAMSWTSIRSIELSKTLPSSISLVTKAIAHLAHQRSSSTGTTPREP
jgi:hypothetical protein